jgi:HPt (histidine-containing phosphotransfer) domain-containing protein
MASLQWDKKFALEQTAGDKELLDELLILFRDSAAADYQQLEEATTARNIEGILTAAHSIKGAASSLGIEGIRILALEIEEYAREAQPIEEKVAGLGELLVQFNLLL